METLITAEHICKRFADRTVLEGVHFSIRAGEVVTLVGLNGCGKTTLLRILLRLEKADSGELHHAEGLKIGYLPQRYEIDRTLPLNINSFLNISAVKGTDIAQISADLEITHLLERSVQALSGGEMQRVLLARAMLRKPDLLVLDEPVRGVDMAGQAALYDLIARLNKAYGCAVLMVSHELHLVMSATDTVLCLNRHICCSGHPHQVSKDPVFINLFGDQVAKNLAVYEHHHDHAHDLRGRVVAGGEKGCTHDG